MGVNKKLSMRRAKQRTTIVGLDELEKQISRIGQFPKEAA